VGEYLQHLWQKSQEEAITATGCINEGLTEYSFIYFQLSGVLVFLNVESSIFGIII